MTSRKEKQQRISESTILAFDTETTGLDPDNDRIVQLGVARFRELQRFGIRMVDLVNPGVPIPDDVVEVHGITNDAVAGAPDFGFVGKRFIEEITNESPEHPAVLCGYNGPGFDVPFINAELKRHSLDYSIDADQVLDPLIFVRWHLRHLRKRTLVFVATRYGYTFIRAHDAGDDAEAAGFVLCEMVREGLIPDDLDAALRLQEELVVKLDADWNRFGNAIYIHRHDGSLRMGFGAHIGKRVDQVDPGYIKWCLECIEDMPTEARDVLGCCSVDNSGTNLQTDASPMWGPR